MRALARYILTGPHQAIMVVAGFALLAFPFRVLIIFSGGALALVTLHQGFKQGVRILLICTLLVVVSTLLVFGRVTPGLLLTWFTIVILANIYRSSQSLNLTLQLFTIFGVVIMVLITIMVPDMQTQWLNYLQGLYEVLAKDPSFQVILQNAKLDIGKVQQYLPLVASVMTGSLVGIYLLTMSLTLFLGRWWHGLQDNVQAFRVEFIALRLGKVLAVFALLFVIGALVVKYAIFWQLAIVCLSMFSLQGMAIAHAVIGQLSYSMPGFVVMYGLLLIATPQMLMVLSTLGVLDSFINFRARFAKPKA